MDLSITLVIIIVTVAVSLYAWNNQAIYQKWLFNPFSVQSKKEYWRFITSGFIHVNYTHLFFNMFALYFFGQNVNYYFARDFGPNGHFLFVGLYILGIIISDIPTYLKHRNTPNYNAVGASGGVAAIVFSSIVFDPLNEIYIMFIPFGIPGFILGALYLVYSYFQSKRMADNINHDAHLYGALFGVIFTVLLNPDAVPEFFEAISNWSF